MCKCSAVPNNHTPLELKESNMNRNSFILSLMLAGAAVCPGLARASVILDDYSTNKSSQYVSYLWNSSPAMAFAITNSALAPHRPWQLGR